ncbi:IS3 family transposase [Nocardia sp. NBC_00511]|uniref:IS3 family transposase n=1 Tax=Nocardia sp. NBC_00511 TaxID=2903591 RepID=UPI00386BD027
MDSTQPRSGGGKRRSFTPAQKLAHLVAYDRACEDGTGGGAYLRSVGLYSSSIVEWRKQRDAGVLQGKSPGEKVGKLTPEQAEIARLKRENDRLNKRLTTTEAALDIMGKAHALLQTISESGGARAATEQTLSYTYTTLADSGVTTRRASDLTGLVRGTVFRRATAAAGPAVAVTVAPAEPSNKLTDLERRRILEVLNSDEFVDSAPLQVYARLLDEGTYLCSVSTMYRVLAENRQVKERRRLARHPAKACPELVATAPRQVYSWDITKLAGPVKGTYYDAYMMIDIYSRYIVGIHVHTHESGLLAKELMLQIFAVHGIPQVVHADRGTSMTSKTVAALLADLEVTRSHSRPRVSNDNPFSESLFKTLKYGPEFPERFGSLWEARQFMSEFEQWYNHEHRHTGLGLHTPADVHFGLAAAKAADRRDVLAAARARHPHRFATTTAPKILDLPDTVWINPPTEKPTTSQEPATTAA